MAAIKPRSMQSGQRNQIRSNDSASLWNCTLSPGWKHEEVQVLRQALMKFGMNTWQKISDSQCLPGKTIAQMNLQVQRMVGQQSLAEFTGLHIDPFKVGEANSKLQGPDIKRKNNFIVNQGGKLTREEINSRRQENIQKYGISEKEYRSIKLPLPLENKSPHLVLETKKAELARLQDELAQVLESIAKAKGCSDNNKEELRSKESSPSSCTDIDVDGSSEEEKNGRKKRARKA